MKTKRMFLSAFLLIIIMYPTASLLVPKELSPNFIEDLESNYHDLKSLYQKAVQLKNLLPEEDFSSISKFLDGFSKCVDDYEYQENRSGRLLQNIFKKFQSMESVVDPSDDPILNEQLLKHQSENLQKLIQKLEEKICGIKADPMMFTMEKAVDLYERIQVLKEKYSLRSDSIEEFYAAKESKETKIRQADQLYRQKQKLEAQIKTLKDDKQSRDFSFESTEGEIRELNKKIEDLQKQIEELEKPESESENASNKVFHYIFLVDTSIREEESQKILEQVNSNIEALKASRESERDIYSLITFNKEVQELADRLDFQDIQSQSRMNYFEKGLEKASHLLKTAKNKGEIPIVIVYTDGMRWYYEVEPVLEEERGSEDFFWFFWKIWNAIVNWFIRLYREIFEKKWFLKPIKESEIHEIQKQLADFSNRFSGRNFIGFVSGTTSQNQEILRDFAKALNRNESVLQTTIGENYRYFNLARATEVFPQIFKTLSVAERGPMSQAFVQEQARKKRQKETEEIRKEVFGQDFDKNKLLKELDNFEKELSELLSKREKAQSEIESLAAEIEKLQYERNSIETKMTSLNEEIRVANEKSFKQQQKQKDREKLEAKYAVIRTHLATLEQLTKTVQARDHNILAIFEYVVTYSKDFLMSFERVLRNNDASDYDLLIAFYKDRLELNGTDAENMEKICQLWLGGSYDQTVARNFFMMISPRDLVENDLEIRKIEQAVEGLHEVKLERRNLDDLKEKYEEFYQILRKKISKSKREQNIQTMSSQRSELKSLFSADFKKLMEKLDKKIYMMY